jgi:hypothetical protein
VRREVRIGLPHALQLVERRGELGLRAGEGVARLVPLLPRPVQACARLPELVGDALQLRREVRGVRGHVIGAGVGVPGEALVGRRPLLRRGGGGDGNVREVDPSGLGSARAASSSARTLPTSAAEASSTLLRALWALSASACSSATCSDRAVICPSRSARAAASAVTASATTQLCARRLAASAAKARPRAWS